MPHYKDFLWVLAVAQRPLLGTYLQDLGFGEFQYILADPGIDDQTSQQLQSHAWLQQGHLIVDITADQFPGIADKVIVAESSAFHDDLGGVVQHVADYRKYNDTQLERLYKDILGRIRGG